MTPIELKQLEANTRQALIDEEVRIRKLVREELEGFRLNLMHEINEILTVTKKAKKSEK